MSSKKQQAGDEMKVVRIAALTLANALIFQEVLSSIRIPGKRPIRAIRTCLADKSPIDAFLEEWRFVLDEVDYIPIFSLARNMLASMSSGPRLELAIRRLANAALLITAKRAALRHDLMGRVYHRLLADAKYYGAFYTTIPAATLLLKLALHRWNVDWSDINQVEKLRIADLACGTGTLLKAALQAVEDNHIRSRANVGLKPALAELHRVLIEKVLMGFDVLPFAVHLSAAALAFHEPGVPSMSQGFLDLQFLATIAQHSRQDCLRARD